MGKKGKRKCNEVSNLRMDPPEDLSNVIKRNPDLFSQVFPDSDSAETDDNYTSTSRGNPACKTQKRKPMSKSNTFGEGESKIENSTREEKLTRQNRTRNFLPAQPEDTSSESENETNEIEYDDEEGSDNNTAEDDTQIDMEDSGESEDKISNDLNDDSSGEDDEPEDDSAKTELRKQLKDLSFEELEVLKQKMGLKEYNEAMFGSKSPKVTKKKNQQFERKNKNRPREVSSKARVPKLRQVVKVPKKNTTKDPRFDEACGNYNEEFWNSEYGFIRDIQKNEAENLKKNMSQINDGLKRREARRFIQKVTDKEKSIIAKKRETVKRVQDKEENRKRVEEGKRPFYVKKSTKKLADLVEKYDELKASGGLDKYLKKKRKRNAVRDRKSLKPFSE